MTPAGKLVGLVRDERLRPWGPGIHVATGSTTFFALPVWNTTAVIESQRPGALAVWNPVALTATVRGSLDDLRHRTGRRVTTLLAALDWHHRYLADWQRAFPDAETLLVSERIRQHQPHVAGRVLDDDRPVVPGWEADLELLPVPGCIQPLIDRTRGRAPRREWLVLHRPSRSLLVGDLLFLHERVTWGERLVGFRAGFTRNAHGFRVRDPAAHEAFVRELLTRDVEQVLTVHGRSTAHGADFLRHALGVALSS